ncbi:MAG: DUF459 domain-containing protein [Alphaproteobacteria bacterium]|nr:DUF459 domain-containing protein [Alphaproteobacteria bacterium]
MTTFFDIGRHSLSATTHPRRMAILQRAIAAVLLWLVLAVALPSIALAQGGDLRNGELNPFPKDDIYRLHFFGDWLMDGLEPALRDSLQTMPRIQVQRGKVELESLRRTNWDKAVSDIRERSQSTPIDMAVVMFGISEIGSVFTPGQDRERFGTDGWIKEYATRVDSVMKALKESKGAVYWISLPIVRRRDHSDAYQVINSLLRERAYANGVTFIDAYSRFQDDSGGFNRYGPDVDGTIKLLRTRDGIYFTGNGNAKIAHLVMQMIRRDLASVKSERVVTLDGDASEQNSIRRSRQVDRKLPGARNRSASGKAGPTTGSFGGQKADDGAVIFETLVDGKVSRTTLTLPRPALSAAIMSLVTRNQSPDKPARLGDNAVQVVDGGVPLLSTVTPANQSALALSQRQLSPTQSVFFKVWGKGERLEPKPGRADDFQWPRPEPAPVVHARSEPEKAERQPPRDPNLPPLPVQRPFR